MADGVVTSAGDAAGRPAERQLDPRLVAAKQRLDRLAYYPNPVRIDGVRLLVAPWLFKLPWLRRFDGWATHRAIFMRRPELLEDPDLVCHELCHVWQMQHRPVRMPLSYALTYETNPYELQARRAAAVTRDSVAAGGPATSPVHETTPSATRRS